MGRSTKHIQIKSYTQLECNTLAVDDVGGGGGDDNSSEAQLASCVRHACYREMINEINRNYCAPQ